MVFDSATSATAAHNTNAPAHHPNATALVARSQLAVAQARFLHAREHANAHGAATVAAKRRAAEAVGKSLHSFTSPLNLSRFDYTSPCPPV